jgi:hypothetical protein
MKQIAGVILLFMMLLASVSVRADEDAEKRQTVVVTGIGITPDKARQNAVRSAVEQVVGAYVKSDTIVQNSTLINDEILSYSGGFVEQTKVLSTKSEDGLYTVQIEAKVVSARIVRKLEALNIATRKVQSDTLVAAALSGVDADRSKKEERASAGLVMDSVLAKFPQAAYRVTIGEMTVESANADANTAKVNIPISVRWDDDFIREFMQTVKTTFPDASEFEAFGDFCKRKQAASTAELGYCFSTEANSAYKAKNFVDRTKVTPELCVLASRKRASKNTMQLYDSLQGRSPNGVNIKVDFKDDMDKTIKVVRRRVDERLTGKFKFMEREPIPIVQTPLRDMFFFVTDGHTDFVMNEELDVDVIRRIKSISATIGIGSR